MSKELKKVDTQFGIAAEADFEENTWTFVMPDGFQVWAGNFAIVDKKVYDEIIAQDRDRWIDAEKKLPDEKIYVLLYHPTRNFYVQGYLYNSHWCTTNLERLPLINFTHWQPLPEPPKNHP